MPSPDGRRTAALLGELVQAQQRFPALFSEPDARALFALDGTLVRTNEVAFALLACDPDDPLGSARHAIAPACIDDRVRAAFARATRGESADAEARVAPRDGGAPIDLNVSFAPARVADTIVGVYAIGRDMAAERAKARVAARQISELSSLFERHEDPMMAIDVGGYLRSVNPAFVALTGTSLTEIVGRPYSAIIASDVVVSTTILFSRAFAGESVVGETVLVHADGTRIDVAGIAVPIVVEGTVVGVYAIGRDVREQRRLEREAREQNERMRELYLVAASTGQTAEAQLHAALALGCEHLRCDGAYLTQIEGGQVTFVACVGRVPQAEGATIPLDASPPCAAIAALTPLDGPAAATDGRTFLGAPIDVGGMRFGAVCFSSSAPRAETFTEADRDFVRLIGALAASAIERGEQRRRLDALAFCDALTGLPNRRLLDDRLAQAIAYADREKTPFAVHFYDLDGFKSINDELGHLRGDEALRIIAHRFERVTRDIDTVARIGGDEFVVVQPDAGDRASALRLAERLREAIAEPFVLDGGTRSITASCGIALYGEHGRDAHALLRSADDALYRVKAAGRDDVAFASPSPNEGAP